MPHTMINYRQHRKLRHTAVMLVGLLVLATSAACSSDGDDDGVASVNSPASTSANGETSSGPVNRMDFFVAIAECMRDKGIDDYPDPKMADDGDIKVGLDDSGIDQDTQEFEAAEKACADVTEQLDAANKPGGALYEQGYQEMLDFAECMRDNDVEEYQDPQRNEAAGFFVPKTVRDDPDYEAAYKECHQLAGLPADPDADGGEQ